MEIYETHSKDEKVILFHFDNVCPLMPVLEVTVEPLNPLPVKEMD
jgi:3-hydroxyacyl-CoA dehydrogenase